MSSSRSVAAARARRSAPEPTQSFKPGPITSINSSTSFNPGSSRLPPNMQQSQQQHQEQPAGKLTVTNAIALISLRIGRLEQFAYQHNLDKTNNELNGYSTNSETSDQVDVDNSVIKNIITRLDLIEKEKKLQTTAQQKHIATPVQPSVTYTKSIDSVAIDTVAIDKFNQEIKSLQDELKETKDLLMKLQSFTMDTNQKLVNIMFHDTNDLDIDQINNSQEDFEYSEEYKNDNVQILDELQPQIISENLKDSINAELAISEV